MTKLAVAPTRPHASAGVFARLLGAGRTGHDFSPRAQGGQAGTQGANAGLTIAVTDDPRKLEADWRSFQETAVATYAQSFDWVSAWIEHVAPTRPVRPALVTGRDASGELAFIWPFVLYRRFGQSVLQWLGQDDSGYGMGLYAPAFLDQVMPTEMAALFKRTLQVIGGVDAVDLHGQPEEWGGYRNPMLALPAQPSANLGYELPLDADYETIYRRAYGKRSRKTHNQMERRLEREGTVEIRNAETPAQRQEVLETFFDQKALQLAEQGIKDVFAEPEIRAFYLALTADVNGTGSPLACGVLTVEGETAATITGIRFQDRFNLLMTSLTPSEIRRWSPGTLLLRDQIAKCCEEGCAHYSMGPGWAEYKEKWRAQPIRLFDTFLAMRLGGNLVTVPTRLRLRLKRTIKSNKVLWEAFQHLRRRVFGK